MTAARSHSPGPALPFILSLTSALVLAAMVSAEAPREGNKDDLLNQVRRMEQVAAQKAEAELRQVLRDGERLSSANPARALERFKTALAALEDDTALSAERRKTWARILKDRIRVTELELADPAGKDQKKQTTSARRAEQDRKAASLEAAERTALALDQMANARKLQKERERNLVGAFRDIDKSSTPAAGDVEFPMDWKERTKNRGTAIKLTEKEKEILKALNTELTVNFRNSQLKDVLDYLQTRLGVNIMLDGDALKEAEASTDTPITLNLKKVTARTVLKKIFADLGMAYVIKDELIQVVSAQKARQLMVVRSYYIADLLAGLGGVSTPPLTGANFPFAPAAQVNPALQAGAQTVQNANTLIELIKTSVDSSTWRDNGGNGTITFHAPSMSLIIIQSTEVHALLANGGLGK